MSGVGSLRNGVDSMVHSIAELERSGTAVNAAEISSEWEMSTDDEAVTQSSSVRSSSPFRSRVLHSCPTGWRGLRAGTGPRGSDRGAW